MQVMIQLSHKLNKSWYVLAEITLFVVISEMGGHNSLKESTTAIKSMLKDQKSVFSLNPLSLEVTRNIIISVILHCTSNPALCMYDIDHHTSGVENLQQVRPIWSSYETSRKTSIEDGYILESDSLPKDRRFFPTISNGFVGYQLFSDTIFVNGLYNGRKGDSHRAKIPSVFPYAINPTKSTPKMPIKYIQDMYRGTFSIHILNDSISLKQTFYAHKLYTRLLISEIKVVVRTPGVYSIATEKMPPEPVNDIKFQEPEMFDFRPSLCNCSRYKDSCSVCKALLAVSHISGKTKITEEDSSSNLSVHVFSSNYPSVLMIDGRERILPLTKKFIFIASFAFTENEAKYFYEQGIKSVAKSMLMNSHENQWVSTWNRGSISVKSNKFTDEAIKSSLYYLLSAFPPLNMRNTFPFRFFGASPGGLSNGGRSQDYFGHVFWDQDFWMVPPMLPIFPEVAKIVLQYRVNNLLYACKKANMLGFQGAAYPWETAYTGYDVCPGINYIRQELHVTADVIHLLKQYVYVSGDWDIFSEPVAPFQYPGVHPENVTTFSCVPISVEKDLKDPSYTAWDMLRETANFWKSRAQWNKTFRRYEIHVVMGPDEWNAPVNNSAFTNVIAAQNLQFAVKVAKKFGICSKLASAWDDVARFMFIPFNSSQKYHPEFDGFVPRKNAVKQADVIMLGFPLMLDMSPQVQKNDLLIYNYSTASYGPAMTWGMFAINWLSVGDRARAAKMYLRQKDNIQPPFNIWSESADGSGAVNFLTGMGGYLQSVIYGYFGLRIHENSVTFDPTTMPAASTLNDVEKMVMSGFQYRRFSFKISIVAQAVDVTLLDKSTLVPIETRACAVVSLFEPTERTVLCNVQDHVVVARRKFKIVIEDIV